MQVDCSASRIDILAPAKLNLFLEVLGRREDGFHEIETVMCPISLCDRLTVELNASGPAIELDVILPEPSEFSEKYPADAAWKVPSNEDNLVVTAARAVQAALGTQLGCHIRLEKRIPSGAGLGGGSSDAAAIIVACLKLWAQWDRRLATKVAAGLGSDIPFFLGNEERIGMALGTGRGEQCRVLSMEPALDFLMMHPPQGCPTGEIYAGYRSGADPRRSNEIIRACETGQFQKIGAELFNALQSVAARLNPWVDIQLALLRESGLNYSLMTGSGSSCFALLGSHERLAHLMEKANAAEIDRVYSVATWYAPSIEQQLGP